MNASTGHGGEVRDLVDWAVAAVGRSWSRSSAGGRASEANVAWDASAADVIIGGSARDSIAVDELLRRGTSGLGLDESSHALAIVDRRCFRFASQGRIAEVSSDERAVFAAVTTFSPDVVLTVSEPTDLAALAEVIDTALPRGAFMVVVRIDATFSWVRVRDPGAGATSLHSVTSMGDVLEWRERVGTLTGIRTPEPSGGGEARAVQFAFVDGDRVNGGFVVDFVIEDANVELSFSTNTRLAVPRLGVTPGPRSY